MRKLLMVPVMLLAACTLEPTNQDPAPGGTAPVDDDSAGAGAGESFDTDITLSGEFITEPSMCSDNSLLFQALVFKSDGTRDFDVSCHFEFADGRTFDNCVFSASIPDLENVTLVATDAALGATVSYSEVVAGPPSFDASLDVATSGMTISWQAGTSSSSGTTRISIDPAANVVATDPNVFLAPTGSVTVTAAGTYTITLDASMPIADTYCGAQVQKTVVIEGTDNPPPCNH
jgi:hypothetical protein